MAINFPDSPSLNDTYVANGVTYTWNGTSWVSAISSATVLNDLSDVDTTGAINGSVIKYDGTNWIIGTDLDVANPFDQDLNTTDSVNFDVVTATSFIGDGSGLTGIPPGYTDSDVDTHLNTGTATSGQVLSWNGSDYAWVADQSGIQLTDLSVGTEATASGDGGIAYDNTTGVFTYTPPDLSGYLTSETVTSLSIVNNILTYTDENGTDTDIDLSLYLDDTNLSRLTSGTVDGLTGIATFTRDDATTFTVDFSDLLNITLADLSVTQNSASGNGTLEYNNTTGVFTYTPPDLSGYLTSEVDTLDSVILRGATTTTTAVIPFYYANQSAFPNATTYHGAMAHSNADGAMYFAHGGVWNELAASSNVGIQLTDLSVGAEDPAAGDGGIAYDNTTGVFTYTPPDLSGYLTSYTETDPVVGAINGIVKADGAGNISAAVEGTDYTLADQSLDTTSNVTFNQLQVDSSITENNHTLTGTSVALDPANGTIQTHTLTGPTTYTDSLADGQSITLLIPATANTITWPTMKWQGGVIAQPDATNDTFISIFKVGTTLYGATIGVFI